MVKSVDAEWLVNANGNGAFQHGQRSKDSQIRDGVSKTAMLAERLKGSGKLPTGYGRHSSPW